MNTKQAIKHLTVDRNLILLPAFDISRDTYLNLKKIMESNLGKYKGGKVKGFEFPFNPDSLLKNMQEGNIEDFRKKYQFFPTPKKVVDYMLNIILPLQPSKILEPSAGQGHIVEAIRDFANIPHEIDCIEINAVSRSIIESKGFNLIGEDFLETESKPGYDYVVMNPPFNIAGDSLHFLKHIEHAIKFLNETGELVSVVPSSISFRETKRINEFKRKFDVQLYQLPTDSFDNTKVDTMVLHYSKNH